LALQGDFQRHIDRINEIGGHGFAARLPEDVRAADAIIIPGGESTTIGKLMDRYGLTQAILDASEQHKPIYGTCAGLILLAKSIVAGAENGGQNLLGLLDMVVSRNSYGRQVDSFEVDIDAPAILGSVESPLRAVFIRAPSIEQRGASVDVLASYAGKPVMVRSGHILASTFHPEISDDDRVHRYFLSMVSPSNRTYGI
jgi:5'-phosphate synthase pdxT subunit